jgi:hypothetical protein
MFIESTINKSYATLRWSNIKNKNNSSHRAQIYTENENEKMLEKISFYRKDAKDAKYCINCYILKLAYSIYSY